MYVVYRGLVDRHIHVASLAQEQWEKQTLGALPQANQRT